METSFVMALLDSALVQAALRALGLALVVAAGLTLLRVRNPHHALTAWTAVLAGALAMPLLMSWMIVSVPAEELAVPAGRIAEPLVALASDVPSSSQGASPARIDGALETASAMDWPAIVLFIYAGVAGLLFLRLTVGLALIGAIRRRAQPVDALWTDDADIRVSAEIAAPVTAGSTILLPRDFESWSEEKRYAVLLHERAHVARGDFYVQALAAVHRAVFWFSPLAWWLHDRLAELAEDASDAVAASALSYRADYAAVLLDFAQAQSAPRFRFAPLAVAMARPATVRRRIERVLEGDLPAPAGRGARFITAALIVLTACAAAVSVVRGPAQAAAGSAEAPLPAIAPVSLPVLPRIPAAPEFPAIPPAEVGTYGRHARVSPIHVELPPVHVEIPEIIIADPHAMDDFDADMAALQAAIHEARASGGELSERIAARVEAAAERAQEKAERARERWDARAEREVQMAASDAPRGPATKETRSVGSFNGVSFGGSGKVFITVGPAASVVLEADPETLSRTRTEVDDDGVLRIRQQGDGWNQRGDIVAYVTVPMLRQARVSGSGELKVGGFNGGETDLSISGSGNVEAEGSLSKLDVSISGSGSARMEGLVVEDAEIKISGSGSALLDVRNSLGVRVSGSGSVRYLTPPKEIDTAISGSGSVRRRDAT